MENLFFTSRRFVWAAGRIIKVSSLTTFKMFFFLFASTFNQTGIPNGENLPRMEHTEREIRKNSSVNGYQSLKKCLERRFSSLQFPDRFYGNDKKIVLIKLNNLSKKKEAGKGFLFFF